MSGTLTASCLCGALAAELRGPPQDVYLCACHACRKASGSAFTYAALFRAEDVTLRGAGRAYRHAGDSGRWIENNFCESCGGSVFFTGEGLPGLIGIAAGALDAGEAPRPRRLYWSSRKPRWLAAPEGTDEVETQ